MINELEYKNLVITLEDLYNTFDYKFKAIGHRFNFRCFRMDIAYFTLSYLHINNTFDDEKIDFIIGFFSKFNGPMEEEKRKLKLVPCPYIMRYIIPISFKIAINVDNLTGDFSLTAKYYKFFSYLVDYMNKKFLDVEFERKIIYGELMEKIFNYAVDSLIKSNDFYNLICSN